MYIRQYSKNNWYDSKVTTLNGNLFYTNGQYTNYFYNEIIKICSSHFYQIKDHNKLKEDIEDFINKISDNK